MGLNKYIRDMKNRILLLCTASLLFTGMSYSQTGNGSKGNAKDSTKVKANPKSSSLTSSSGAKPCPGKTCGKKKS
jgi:hypothetical protein